MINSSWLCGKHNSVEWTHPVVSFLPTKYCFILMCSSGRLHAYVPMHVLFILTQFVCMSYYLWKRWYKCPLLNSMLIWKLTCTFLKHYLRKSGLCFDLTFLHSCVYWFFLVLFYILTTVLPHTPPLTTLRLPSSPPSVYSSS